MIVDGVDYKITYPFGSDWDFSFYDVTMSSGNLRRFDRGINADVIFTSVDFKVESTEIDALLNALGGNPNIAPQSYEPVFGVGIEALAIAQIGQPRTRRINNNFFIVSVQLACTVFNVLGGTTDNTADLYYPNNYSNGIQRTFDYIQNTTGLIETYQYDDKQGMHGISFLLPDQVAIDFKGYLVQTVRANAFSLNTDWQAFKPFTPENWDYALLLSMSESKNSNVTTTLTIELQGYDNG